MINTDLRIYDALGIPVFRLNVQTSTFFGLKGLI